MAKFVTTEALLSKLHTSHCISQANTSINTLVNRIRRIIIGKLRQRLGGTRIAPATLIVEATREVALAWNKSAIAVRVRKRIIILTAARASKIRRLRPVTIEVVKE